MTDLIAKFVKFVADFFRQLFKTIGLLLLGFFCFLLPLFNGISVLINAQSVMHQIYGILLLIFVAICALCAAVIGLSNKQSTNKQQ